MNSNIVEQNCYEAIPNDNIINSTVNKIMNNLLRSYFSLKKTSLLTSKEKICF